MKIGLDLDGVCYDFIATANFLLKHNFGYDLPRWTSWDFAENVIRKEHWSWLWKKGLENGLFRHGHCVKGTFEGIKVIEGLGHEIVFLTSRPKAATVDTYEWLQFHLQKDDLNLEIVENHDKKTATAVQLGVNLHIDDKPSTCKEMKENGIEAILFSQPHNASNHFQPRVAGWGDLVKFVRAISISISNKEG